MLVGDVRFLVLAIAPVNEVFMCSCEGASAVEMLVDILMRGPICQVEV